MQAKHAALLAVLALAFAGRAGAQIASSLPVSKGVYDFPFESGTTFVVTSDHITHPTTRNRVDLASSGNGTFWVVAAAGGWIRYIVDTNTIGSCDDTVPGCANNYVWIEHPNGEWTKYTHMSTNSVTNLGWAVNDWVNSNERLGIEDDIGFASGNHVHFEVAVPNDPANPIDSAGFLVGDGDPTTTNFNRQNRIPVFCDAGIVYQGTEITKNGPCSEQCVANWQLSGTADAGEAWRAEADVEVGTSNAGLVIADGAGIAMKSEGRVVLRPGFRAELGSYASASISECHYPGAP